MRYFAASGALRSKKLNNRYFHELKKILYSSNPETVYLVKLNENDIIISDSMILISNFNYGSQLYLLDVEPGRYIVFAAFEEIIRQQNNGDTFTNYSTYYFPEAMMKLTDATVKKGDIIYLGSYTVDVPFSLSYGLNKPDETQSHYCK